ncbi:MAG: aromatic amino acid transport family protein [Chlamydiales bacterium]
MKTYIEKGSVPGGILLISGSCIGAGMLALPIITGIAGFGPSIVMFIFSWLFMTTTGLLLLEANLAVGHDLSLVSIAEKTLGKGGKIICWIFFVFLFYTLSVAYIAASGEILQSILFDFIGVQINPWIGSLFFTLVFALFLYFGTRQVDYLNRLLMGGLVVFYCILIFLGSMYVNIENLKVSYWKYTLPALPLLIVSFGFHNMIPSLAMYLNGDRRRLRITVVLGSTIPLLIYLLWEVVILGIIPLQGREGLIQALDQGEVATQTLRHVVGRSWINSVGQAFALSAIVTSFLAQSLSLLDFLSDGLKITKVGWRRVSLIFLTLAPPLSFAYIYPGIFIRALNIGGGFSAVILFGIMPALMAWKIQNKNRFLLTIVILIAISIFTLELAQELGLSLIPKEIEVRG